MNYECLQTQLFKSGATSEATCDVDFLFCDFTCDTNLLTDTHYTVMTK